MTCSEAMQVLGLSSGFTDDDLRKAYRTMTRKYHPDVNHAPDAEEVMARINEAYAFLQKPENRVEEHAVKHRSIFDIVDA
jgi:molecular chaperone DnaJ